MAVGVAGTEWCVPFRLSVVVYEWAVRAGAVSAATWMRVLGARGRGCVGGGALEGFRA